MKRILITGGAGFIGSNLCKRLLDAGNKVLCLDNLYSGSKDNIENLEKDDNFSFYKFDVIDRLNYDVDEIYHLACPASLVAYQKDPIFTFKTNIIGSLNSLDLAVIKNSKILLSSTSEVYGDPIQQPQKESYWGNVNPNGIRSCYDEGKRGAESLFFDYRRQYNLRIKIARIFNCYGPNMAINDSRVISNFIVAALRNEPITIYGNGYQTRSFCYVDDLIDGFIKLMNSSNDVTGPINLGNPQEITIEEIAKTILILTNSSSKIVYRELPQEDPKRRKPDISLAKNILQWKPKVSLEDGLLKTISYFEFKLSKL